MNYEHYTASVSPQGDMTQESFDRDCDAMIDELRKHGVRANVLQVSAKTYAEMRRKGITRPDLKFEVGSNRKQFRKAQHK